MAKVLGGRRPPLAAWRRREVHSVLPLRAERIVLRALPGIAEHLVGLVDLLESLGRLVALALRLEIRMLLARNLTICALDLVRRGRARNAQHFVVVAELHRHLGRPPPVSRSRPARDGAARLPSRHPRGVSLAMVPC